MFVKNLIQCLLIGSYYFLLIKGNWRLLGTAAEKVLCRKWECQRCHFLLTPEAIPGLIGSDVRTALEEFLLTFTSNPHQTFSSLRSFKEALETLNP